MIDRLREITLWVGAVLGLLSVVAGTAVMFFGYTFLIFRSGSMGPEIPTGSVALAKTVPAAELEPGDVVSVIAVSGERVTHRLVDLTVRGDEASLILQGDTNDTPDAEIYVATEAQRSIASLPYLGYAVTVLLSPAGLLGAGCLSGMLLLMSSGSREDDLDDFSDDLAEVPAGGGPDDETPARRTHAVSGMAISLVAIAAVLSGAQGTSAFFTDRGTATTGTFSMAVPAQTANPPTGVACRTVGTTGDYITWSAPTSGSPTGYRLTYTESGVAHQVQNVASTVRQARPSVDGSGNRTYDVRVQAIYSFGDSVSVSTTIRWVSSSKTWAC